MIWILASTLFSVLIYYFVYKPSKYWSQRNVKHTTSIPLFGDNFRNLLQQESIVDMVKRIYDQYKDERYVGFSQMSIPTLMLRDLDLIKQIAVKDFDHFVDHLNFAADSVEQVWNRNLVSLKGDEWRDMRATLSPTFTSSKMRSMFVLMEKSAQQYVDFYLNKDPNKSVLDIELKDSFSRFANDVIANCAFGITVDSLKEPENTFYKSGKEITNISGFWINFKFMLNIVAPKVAAFLKLSVFSPIITRFFKTIIQDTIKLREEQNIHRPDMINLLMEAQKGRLHHEDSSENNSKDAGFATVEESEIGHKTTKKAPLTDTDMAAQVLIFFFAGFDTISTMMSFLCYELALHPEIQDKLHREITRTFSENQGKLNYDALNKMKYLDMVITESMRKHPAAIISDRVCTKAYTIEPVKDGESPVEIKPGDVVWLPIYGIHRDETYYPNADQFDPERFSDENKADINPYSYLPFGIGPRNCIGSRFALMECKTLMFHVLLKFEMVVVEKTTVPIKYAKNQFNPFIEGGFWVGFKRRKGITTVS